MHLVLAIISLTVIGTHGLVLPEQPHQTIVQEQPILTQPVDQVAHTPCSLATDVSPTVLPPCQPSDSTQIKEKMYAIFIKGTALAKILTAKLAAPYVFASSKISAMAGALPPIMAKQGAILGHIIAAPIQVSSVINSGLVSGATGVAVGIPVGIGTGLTAAAVGLKERFKNTDVIGEVKSKAIAGGNLLMKPFLLMAAGKTFLVGKSVKLAGMALDKSGQMMSGAGQAMTTAGLGLKGISGGLVGKALGSQVSGINMPVVMLDDSVGSLPLGDLLSAIPPPLLTSLLGLGSSLGINPSLGGMVPLGDSSIDGSGTSLPMDATHAPFTIEEVANSTLVPEATTLAPTTVPATTLAP